MHTREGLQKVSIKQLKSILISLNVDYSSCVEKGDLVKLILQEQPNDSAAAENQKPKDKESSLSSLSIKEIKKRLDLLSVDYSLCVEKRDLVTLLRVNENVNDDDLAVNRKLARGGRKNSAVVCPPKAAKIFGVGANDTLNLDAFHPCPPPSPVGNEAVKVSSKAAKIFGIDENGKQITISKTQRYKMLGNGWCVDTIAHILRFLEGRI